MQSSGATVSEAAKTWATKYKEKADSLISADLSPGGLRKSIIGFVMHSNYATAEQAWIFLQSWGGPGPIKNFEGWEVGAKEREEAFMNTTMLAAGPLLAEASSANRAVGAIDDILSQGYRIIPKATERAPGLINPNSVRFTQSSHSPVLRNGNRVDELAATLRGPKGAEVASQMEPIRLVEFEGHLWSLDHRRLAAFSQAQRDIPFRMATAEEIALEWSRKFQTSAELGWGRYIQVKPRKAK